MNVYKLWFWCCSLLFVAVHRSFVFVSFSHPVSLFVLIIIFSLFTFWSLSLSLFLSVSLSLPLPIPCLFLGYLIGYLVHRKQDKASPTCDRAVSVSTDEESSQPESFAPKQLDWGEVKSMLGDKLTVSRIEASLRQVCAQFDISAVLTVLRSGSGDACPPLLGYCYLV